MMPLDQAERIFRALLPEVGDLQPIRQDVIAVITEQRVGIEDDRRDRRRPAWRYRRAAGSADGCRANSCTQINAMSEAKNNSTIMPAKPTNMRCHRLGNAQAVDASTYGVGMNTRNMMPISCTSPPNRRQENAWPSSWMNLMRTNIAQSKSRLIELERRSMACWPRRSEIASNAGRAWRSPRVTHDQPDNRPDLAEHDLGQRHPANEKFVRVPQRNAGEQHVHQPALHLPLVELFVPAKQDGGIGRDVGVDQIGRVQLGENLDDFRLGRRIVFELAADHIPTRASTVRRAVEQADEPIRRVGKPVELVSRRIADDIPPLAAIILPGNLCLRRSRPAGWRRGTRIRKMSVAVGGS